MIKLILNVIAAIFLTTSICQADELTASLNQNEVAYGDGFELTLTYNGNDAGAMQVDLGDLQTDFAIYSTSSSVRSSFVNGVGSMQRQWKIGLMPKKTGVLTIPEIKAGQYKSQTLQINVLPAGSAVQQQPKSQITKSVDKMSQVEADLQLDNTTPYVQQELNAVLVINDNKGIEFTAEPQFITNADEWIVKTLRQPTVEANGHGGRLIKFYYALFPQKSGLQQIPAMQIEGMYTSFDEDNNQMATFGGLSNFFNMNMGNLFGVRKPIRLMTKPQDVNVLPIAAGYGNDWWLPAGAVGVAERWVDEHPTFKVGETVAREIAFAAEGVADTQLPEITLPTVKNVKQYPEKPQIESIADKNHITSQLKMRIVYIPQVVGKQVIPEIRIPWYNVNTKQKQVAIIPAATIDVEGGTENAVVSDNISTNTDTAAIKSVAPVKKGAALNLTWLWIALAFIAGLILSYVILKRTMQSNIDVPQSNLKGIEQSLQQKDYRQLRDSLLEYGRQIFRGQNINNLNDLATCIDEPKFTEQMQILNSILYAGQTGQIDDNIILSTLKNKQKQHHCAEKKPLPDLYK